MCLLGGCETQNGPFGGCERELTCGLANKHTVNFMKGSLVSKYLKKEEFRKNTENS